MTNELAKLNNWALHIEDSIRKRNEPINDEDTQYSENNLNSEFVETIDWESDSLSGLRDKIEQNIRYDRVNPSEDNLNKIRSYLEQVRDKTSVARIEILPLCDLYNIKNDGRIQIKKAPLLLKIQETYQLTDFVKLTEIV